MDHYQRAGVLGLGKLEATVNGRHAQSNFTAAQGNKISSRRSSVCCGVHHAQVCDGEGSAVLLHRGKITSTAMSGGGLRSKPKQESNRAVYAWLDCFCQHLNRFKLRQDMLCKFC